MSAFAADLGVVLAAAALTGNLDKPAAELNTAPLILERLDLRGRVITGDALLCQRSLCVQIVAGEGDYLSASTELAGLVDWPHLAQVFLVIRSWESKGQAHQEMHWGVTSLPAGTAAGERLLEIRRGHWRIENSLHYAKDVTLGEDKSLIHVGEGPAVLSLLRDGVVSVLHRAGFHQIAARLRHNSRHPEDTLPLLGLALS